MLVHETFVMMKITYTGLFVKYPEVHAKVCWASNSHREMGVQAWSKLRTGLTDMGTS